MYCQDCGMLKSNCVCGRYNKSDKNQELKKGVIVSVLPNKKAGFIRCDEYPDNLYFNMNEFKHNITLAKTGQNVTFYETDGFDKKKNKQVKNAVNIYLNGG